MPWIDLSLPIQTGMPVFPGDPPVVVETVQSLAKDGFQLSRMTLGSHTGTHLDAPRHFLAGGDTVDQLPLDRLCGPAFVAGWRVKDGEPIDLKRLDMSGFQSGDALLLATGWDSRAGSPGYYENIPLFTAGSADWLLQRGIRLFGLDLPTVCDGIDPEAMHIQLLDAGVVIIESLIELAPLAGRRVDFQALPLRLVGCDGSPVRAAARVSLVF